MGTEGHGYFVARGWNGPVVASSGQLQCIRRPRRLESDEPVLIPLVKRRACVVVALLALMSASLHAQRVRGAVFQADGTTPAAGVVVAVNGADGAVAARALSSGNGAFDMHLPAGGTYSLSALRIGFRPTVVGGVSVPDSGAATVRIVLVSAPLPLAAVDVRSRDVCGTSGDPQSGVVQLWTQARTALAAAALWSRESLDAEWITFRRELRPTTDFVRSQEVRLTRSPTTHAFKSVDADSLAEFGYMFTEGAISTYHAPDPDVLLSDRFAETHCFHLEPARQGEAGLVGVGFTPQRLRDHRVDIEGTLWMERATSELRWLEYRYVGLTDAADAAQPGGRVEFLHLPDGPWMVSRWHIRMPSFGALPATDADGGYSRSVVKSNGAALHGVSVGGGMIARVERRGQLLYEGAGSGVALQLTSSDADVRVAGALVKLDGTDYAWRADSTGLVRASPVLDGRYTALIATPEMIALDAAPVERELRVNVGRTRLDSASVPTARDIVRRSCGGDAARNELGVLYGTVRDSAGRPAAGRAVFVTWLGAVAAAPGGRLYAGHTTIGTMADDAGRWHACEVPRDRALTARSTGDDGAATADAVIPASRWLAEVPLQITKITAALVQDSTVASLEIVVKDAAGIALGPTSLELTAWNGAQRKITTDARGRALVAAFPPGAVKMRAKRPGYTTGDVVFTAAAGRNTVPLILGQETLPMLDSVRVAGNRRTSSRIDGFDTRRARREATASFSADDIAKRGASEIADLLRGVSGVRMIDSSGVPMAELRRGFTMDRGTSAQPCLMRVVLDGVLVPIQAGVNVVRLPEVRGVEVFASSARMPSGLGITASDAACGLIAVYTGRD